MITQFDENNIKAYQKNYETVSSVYVYPLKMNVYEGELDKNFLRQFRNCLYDYQSENLNWIIQKNRDNGQQIHLVQVAINDHGEKVIKVEVEMVKKQTQLTPSRRNGVVSPFWWGILAGLCGISLFETLVGLVVLQAVEKRERED